MDNKPCLIFDFFGVICAETFNTWLKNHQLENRHDEAISITRRADVGDISFYEEMQLLAKISGQKAQEVYDEFNGYAKINQDLVKFIKENQDKYRFALLSNSVAKFVRPILSSNYLDELFEKIFISSELGKMKPNSDIYWHVVKSLNLPPQKCIMIDDKQRNIDGARAIGMQGVLYNMILNTK